MPQGFIAWLFLAAESGRSLSADRQPLSDVQVDLAVGADVQPEQRGQAAPVGGGEQSGILGVGLIPQLLTPVLPWMQDTRIRRRGWIAATIAAMARHPELADQRSMLTTAIEREAIAEQDARELATFLIALGDLGSASRTWLEHHHVGVRLSAAIALTLAGDDPGATMLREAARERTTYFLSFDDVAPPAQFMTAPHGRDVLMEALQLLDGEAN
jgi:hypothetical protein